MVDERPATAWTTGARARSAAARAPPMIVERELEFATHAIDSMLCC